MRKFLVERIEGKTTARIIRKGRGRRRQTVFFVGHELFCFLGSLAAREISVALNTGSTLPDGYAIDNRHGLVTIHGSEAGFLYVDRRNGDVKNRMAVIFPQQCS